MNIMEITQKDFDNVVTKHDLIVIDFWAEWCGPCKSFKKVVEAVSEKYPEVIFGGVNIDNEKELAEEFQIQSVPSVMILRNRVVVFAESGALSVSALSDLIEQAKTLDLARLKEKAKGT